MNTPSALTGRHPSKRGEFSLYPVGTIPYPYLLPLEGGGCWCEE